MADRYSYLPMIGPVLSLVWWLGDEFSKWWQCPKPALVIATGLAVVCPLFILTRHQLRYWQNTLTLFDHAVAVTGDNPSAQFGVGMGLLEQGQASRAMVRFRVALAIDPSYARAHFIMGQLLRMRGDLAAAAEQYEAALRANPADVRSQVNLAGILPLLGRARDARQHLEQALRDDPNSAEALNNLAWLLATNPDPALRDGPRAVRCGQRACALSYSKQPAFLGTLAAAYAEIGDFSRAVATAQQAEALARASGDAQLAARTENLLQLYRAGKACRDTIPGN
jgi:tetratricopeptide (TPR) repeat protein